MSFQFSKPKPCFSWQFYFNKKTWGEKVIEASRSNDDNEDYDEDYNCGDYNDEYNNDEYNNDDEDSKDEEVDDDEEQDYVELENAEGEPKKNLVKSNSGNVSSLTSLSFIL